MLDWLQDTTLKCLSEDLQMKIPPSFPNKSTFHPWYWLWTWSSIIIHFPPFSMFSCVQTGSKFLMDLSKDLGFVEGYTTQRLSKMLFLHFQNSNYHPGMLTWRSCHYIVILFHPHQHCYRTGTGLQTILSPAMISGELRAPSFSTPQALLNLKSPSLIPHIPKTFQCIEGRSG